jgi:hypothetical protein
MKSATFLTPPSNGFSGTRFSTHKSVRINDTEGPLKYNNREVKSCQCSRCRYLPKYFSTLTRSCYIPNIKALLILDFDERIFKVCVKETSFGCQGNQSSSINLILLTTLVELYARNCLSSFIKFSTCIHLEKSFEWKS